MAAESHPQQACADAEDERARDRRPARHGGGAGCAGATIQKPEAGLAGNERAILLAGAIEAIPRAEFVGAAELLTSERARAVRSGP